MRCTIENKHLPALRSLAEAPKHDENGPEPEAHVRIAVTESGVVIDTPYGKFQAESRVCEPGVVFVPMGFFRQQMSQTHTRHYIEVRGSESLIAVNEAAVLPSDGKSAFFPDPATAPRKCP